MKTVTRKQFAGLDDKRFQIHKDILNIKDYLIGEEHKASSKCERVRILRSILAQSPTYYKTDSKNMVKIFFV